MVDFFRVLIGLLSWNARKSTYRIRGGRCPCQSPSDSGLAGITRCEASLDFDQPARFRHICPALQPTEWGLRCHLDTADVRPFWLRAITIYACLFLGLYLCAGTTLYEFIHYRGLTQVKWVHCIWPRSWDKIAEARSDYFREKSARALFENDANTGILALASAVVADPQNLPDALNLARIYEHIGQFAASEEIFTDLVHRFPEQQAMIALAHHDAVLVSGRLSALQELAWRRLLESPEPADAWFAALAIAAHDLPVPATIWTDRKPEIDALPPPLRTLLALAAPPRNSPPELRGNAALALQIKSPLLARLRWEWLALDGQREAARQSIAQDTALLGKFETDLALIATTDPRVHQSLFDEGWHAVTPFNLRPGHVERMCAVALRMARPITLSSLIVRVPNDDQASLSALWVLARIKGDYAMAESLLTTLGFDPHEADFQLTAQNIREKLPPICAVLPIPRDVLYSLVIISSRPNQRHIPPTNGPS